MDRTITYQITEADNGSSILSFLKARQYTHSVLVGLKKTENSILLNGKWAYVNEQLRAGDILEILLHEYAKLETILPNRIPLDILYEDADLIAINKPSHMPVHPSLNHYENTLANALAAYNAERGIRYPFRCINRLDRDTTGLTIVAKHALSAGILGSQVREHSMKRTYAAICQGRVPEKGTIRAKIARKEDSAMERCINEKDGEEAITHYRRLLYRPDFDLSFVALQLETGRTHQIRVHMKALGYPLIGDFLYNPVFDRISRQALHACALSFDHPITQERLSLYAPLPDDLQRLFPSVQLPCLVRDLTF